MIAGVVCVLADVRDYRTCAPARRGVLRITVEETRDATTTDVAGHFTLPLSQKLAIATVAVVDPTNNFAPTIVPVRLTNGVANNIALPDRLAADAAIDRAGERHPRSIPASASSSAGPSTRPARRSPASRPATRQALYDDAGANALSPGTATHSDGTIACLRRRADAR